ncbi:MAG: FecR domain-containing protein [Tannerellaceae bacterium]|jgi:ferric-dicitrate binding protein FerR (iron transport regulator)|nr:FecR domain-containing protein [Tannerellaceae bacterium]
MMEKQMDQEIEQIIIRNLTGEGSCDDMVKLSEWLALEEENRTSFLRVHKYWSAALPGVSIRDKKTAYQQLLKRIKESEKKPSAAGRHSLTIRHWMRYAGIVAGIAILTSMYWLMNQKAEETHHYSYITGDSPSAFELPNGTKTALNKNSTLAYSTTDTNDIRTVTLQGEAFFDVRPNKDKPFAVSLGKTTVTVLGTSFNVKNYPEDSLLAVTLIKGSIRFDTPEQTVVLQPDQHLVYNKLDNKIRIDIAESSLVTAWKDHLLRYKSIPFAEFLSLLEEQYRVEIILLDKELGSHKVSGAFDLALSVDQILNLTKKNLSFNWKKEGNKYLIIK